MSCAFSWGEAELKVFVGPTERNGNDVIGINDLLLSVGEHNSHHKRE
jgi:hypothetical protein